MLKIILIELRILSRKPTTLLHYGSQRVAYPRPTSRLAELCTLGLSKFSQTFLQGVASNLRA